MVVSSSLDIGYLEIGLGYDITGVGVVRWPNCRAGAPTQGDRSKETSELI